MCIFQKNTGCYVYKLNISAVKWLITINCIQNKNVCLHYICVYTVYIYYIYIYIYINKYTQVHVYISERRLYVYILNISAVKGLIAIYRIQNKVFCLHYICVYTVYIIYIYIYKYTHVHVYISEKYRILYLYIKY